MAKKLYNESDIQNIADAIRDKNGTQDKYKVSEMAQAIEDISGGGDAYVFFQKPTGTTIDLSQYSLEGLTELRNYAFYYYNALTNISLPSGLTSIGANAFNNCSRLTELSLPSGLKSIDTSAFAFCADLTKVSLPSGLTSIGANAFNNCGSLKTVLCYATTPPSATANSFMNTHADLAIYVPDESVSAYQSKVGWSNYASKIHPMSEYTPS